MTVVLSTHFSGDISFHFKMDRKLILDFDRKQKALKNKKKKSQHGPPSKQPKVEDTSELPKPSASYRDRAKERREGLNKDFELDPDDLKISNPIINSVQEEGDPNEIDLAERRRQQIEESKYLGGDIEHTHLVKGLDFALLEKVKNDQKLAERLAQDSQTEDKAIFGQPDSDSEEEEFRNEAILAASAAAGSKKQMIDLVKLSKNKSTKMVPCRTAVARQILNVLDEKWPNQSELFLPGRMSYVIPIDDDDDAGVTTILRSKADTLVNDDDGDMNESDFALDQLINILERVRKGQTSSNVTKKTRGWDPDMTDYNY